MPKYYNSDNVEISDQIDTGNTKLFENRDKAHNYALRKKSYVYDVYKEVRFKGKKWYAFGVPK